MIYYIKKSILEASTKHIAHGVNCQNQMNSGVARVLFEEYPEIKSKYHDYFSNVVYKFDNKSEDLLGRVQFVESKNKIILNLFTQNIYGSRNDYKLMQFKYVRYDAIHDCFSHILKCGVKEISIPKIGSGKGGGDWEIIEKIINNVVKDKMKVFVYEV